MTRCLIALYRALLFAYPPRHRRDYGDLMVQLFADQCRDAQRAGRPAALLILAWRTLGDLVLTVLVERLDTMKQTMTALVGLALLVVPIGFFASVILEFYLGLPSGPLHVIYQNAGRTLVDIMIVSGPPLALLVVGLPLLREVWQRIRSDGFSTSGVISQVMVREHTVALIVIGVGLALGLIFTAYFLAENWTCLIGRMLDC